MRLSSSVLPQEPYKMDWKHKILNKKEAEVNLDVVFVISLPQESTESLWWSKKYQLKCSKSLPLCSTGFCVQPDFMFNWKMSISSSVSNRNVFFLQVFSNFSQVAASEYYFQLYAFVSYGFEMFILLFASLFDLICVSYFYWKMMILKASGEMEKWFLLKVIKVRIRVVSS